MGGIGIVGISYVSGKDNPNADFTPLFVISAIHVVIVFLGIGTFRVLILNVEWKAYQIVLMKLCFLICSLFFTILAFDLIVNDWATDAMKDFIFLYLFGMVTTVL